MEKWAQVPAAWANTHARCESSGLRIGREVSLILLSGIALGAFSESAARVLPGLALVVPVKPKLGQNGGDLAGLLLCEVNPDPLADNLGNIEEARCFLLEQGQNPIGGQLTIRPAAGEIDRRERWTLRRWLCLCGCARNGSCGFGYRCRFRLMIAGLDSEPWR